MNHAQTASEKKHPPKGIRILLGLSIILLAGFSLYPLSNRLAGQLQIKQANQFLDNSQYPAAIEHFLNAADYLPDDFQVRNSLADAFYRSGVENLAGMESNTRFQQAADSYQQALQLNPLDARSAYGLARAAIRQEQYTRIKDRKGAVLPTPALQALETAVALRPASTAYRLTLTRYLYLHNDTEGLLSQVRILGRLQPASYSAIRGQPFWTSQARAAFLEGLEAALAADVFPRQTRLTAADIMAEQSRLQEAIDYRQQGMLIQPSLNRADDYIRLGYFYLLGSQVDSAGNNFFLALEQSSNIEQDMISILRTCRNGNDAVTLIAFYDEAGKKFGYSKALELAAARYLFDLKEYGMAGKVLSDANQRQPSAEKYYLQSRIAERLGDWDAVELAIQKATVHEPRNSTYHLRFSQVLNRMQKYERSEKEAGLAIRYQQTAAAGLYHYRAGLRIRLKQYDGAMLDWQKAFELDPENKTYVNQLERVKKLSRKIGQ